ncbi:MAG: SDR family NAD(P)-dependent oxidoreductase, partial [Pseudomonadota bacterium]
MLDLSGKVALVTGASRGIGLATAEVLAAAGAAVVLAARSGATLQKHAENIRGQGGRALAVPCDVSAFDDMASAIAQTLEAFGGLDILVNNAGVIDPIARIADSDPTDWGKAVDINVKGVYHGLRAAI